MQLRYEYCAHLYTAIIINQNKQKTKLSRPASWSKNNKDNTITKFKINPGTIISGHPVLIPNHLPRHIFYQLQTTQ